MEEEKFVKESVENISFSEPEEPVKLFEDEEIILSTLDDMVKTEVKEEEVFNITISENVGAHALNIVSDHGFNLPRQHSIGAIEGLREELDKIERLKTVYSDGKNQANYYLWHDENPSQENRVGYFVSVYQTDGVNKIRLCNSLDEFGVTVSDAGFIGNQSEECLRDSKYGIVVHSGVVAVKCEGDVEVEDYVVSNKYGRAKKTDGTYGHYVNSISVIDGERHAIISLATGSKPLQEVSAIAQDVAERMENAEYNIVTNRNLANDAYAMAQNAIKRVNNNNTQVNDHLNDIMNKVNSTTGRVDDLITNVGQAQNSASNALSTVESIKNQVMNASAEAIAQANSALQEAQRARDEVYDVRDEFKTEVEEAQSKAQKAQEDFSQLSKEMDVLSEWSDGVYTGISGLLSKTDDHSTQLAAISSWQSTTTENIAGIQTTAETASARIDLLTSCVNTSCDVIDTWSKTYEADKDTSKVYYVKDEQQYYYYDAGQKKWITSETAAGAGLTESIAYVTQLTDENSAAISQTASHIGKTYTTITEWPQDTKNLDITRVYYVENTGKYYYYEQDTWVAKKTAPITHLSNSIATVEQKALNNEAEIKLIVSREDATAKLIAGIGSKVGDNEASITNLTSYIDRTSYIKLERWPEDTTELDIKKIYFVDSYVTYETIAKWDTANLDSTKVYYAEDTNKYYVYQNDTWVDQNTAPDGAEIPAYYYYFQDHAWRVTEDPTDAGLVASIASVIQKANDNEASIQNLTEWQGESNGAIATLTQRADDSGAIIEGLVSNVNKYSVGDYSQANGLTHNEAKTILKSGTVFIPTSEHDEKYSEEYTQEFSKGFYYTWNGNEWIESSSSGSVSFSDTYIIGSAGAPYWVVGDSDYEIYSAWNEEGKDTAKTYYVVGADKHYYYYENNEWINVSDPKYKVGALYKWENKQWVEVMTRESNMISRSTSLIQQKANEITLSVIDVKGGLAALETKVDEGGATTSMIASVVTHLTDEDGNLISITDAPYSRVEDIVNPQANEYYAVGDKSPYAVYAIKDDKLTKIPYLYYDGVNITKPNIASIISTANDDTTSITLSAQKINFDGYSQFINTENGTITSISGDLIQTGTIKSNDGTVAISLGDSTAGISGRITAISGYVGNKDNGFTIDSRSDGIYYLGNDQISYDGDTRPDGIISGSAGVYIGPDGIGLGNGNFYVSNTGNLTTNGSITMGGNIDMDGTITMGGSITLGGDITFASNGRITWDKSNSPVLVLYSRYTTLIPSNRDEYEATDENTTRWHRTYQTNDKYAVYSYDGGHSWTSSAIQIMAKDGKDGEDANRVPYIKDTYISSTNILSPKLYGGLFYATGQGNLLGTAAAYYVYNGLDVSDPENPKPLNMKGYISYDEGGAGTAAEAKKRMFITTVNDTALKIHSASDMSISTFSEKGLYINTGHIQFSSLNTTDDGFDDISNQYTPSIWANDYRLATQDWVIEYCNKHVGGGSGGTWVAVFG